MGKLKKVEQKDGSGTQPVTCNIYDIVPPNKIQCFHVYSAFSPFQSHFFSFRLSTPKDNLKLPRSSFVGQPKTGSMACSPANKMGKQNPTKKW